MVRSGEVANAAEISRRKDLTRARVSQLLRLLRLHPAILVDLEDEDRIGPVPTEGALRKLSGLPEGKQMVRYRQLIRVEESNGRPRANRNRSIRGHAHLPRRGFVHLFEQARRYQSMLDRSVVRSIAEIGRQEGISEARVGQVLCLLQLAPDILEWLEESGRESLDITRKELLRVARMRGHAAQRRAFYSRLDLNAGRVDDDRRIGGAVADENDNPSDG